MEGINEVEPEPEKTFFDLPKHLREIIWKHARRINVEEGCERLVAPLHDLKIKINKELSMACSIGETNTIMTLLNLGADPIHNKAMALLASVMHDQVTSINYLLVYSRAFDDPKTKPYLKQALRIAQHRKTITNDNTIVDQLKEHYKYVFSSDIETDEVII